MRNFIFYICREDGWMELTFEYEYDPPGATLMDDFHVMLGYRFELEEKSRGCEYKTDPVDS